MNASIKKTRLLRVAILVVAIFVIAGFTRAQLFPLPLSLTASPESPSPGQTVVITTNTPTSDRNSTAFNWVINNKSRPDLSGLGKNAIEMRAGTLGSTIEVEVEAIGSASSGNIALSIPVSDLTLTWFAKTLVPKWYKGRPLPVQNSLVNVVAVPQIILDGTRLKPEDLIYTWGMDDRDRVASGVGMQILKIRTSDLPYSSHNIKVTVQDPDKLVTKTGKLFIEPSFPRLAVYPSSPLGGIEWRSATSSVQIIKRGFIDFVAEAFFFPTSSKKNLNYQWIVKGKTVTGEPENPDILTLDTGKQQKGDTVPISVNVNDSGNLFSPLIKTLALIIP